jgi:hypothetical protein
VSPEAVPYDGRARVLIGSYGAAISSIKSPSPMNWRPFRHGSCSAIERSIGH